MTIDRLKFLQDLIEKEQQLSMTGCFFKEDADDIVFLIGEEIWYEEQRQNFKKKVDKINANK